MVDPIYLTTRMPNACEKKTDPSLAHPPVANYIDGVNEACSTSLTLSLYCL